MQRQEDGPDGTGRVSTPPLRTCACRCFLGLALLICGALPAPVQAQDANTMRTHLTALADQLANSPLQRPIHIESIQNEGELKGDVYALVDQPYGVASKALQGMDHWCDILILHLNVKLCRAGGSGAASSLILTVGTKYDQPIEDAYVVDFNYRVTAATPDYLLVGLSAENGPMGTSHYRIVLEAVPVDAQRSFIHMSYSYTSGLAARLAMQAYLATVGHHKVGFSIAGQHADGKPVYIGNVRGVVERNTMRYYLAIEAYLGALSVPLAEQQEKRLNDWHAAVERYPVQLHEIERDEYLVMKHREILRQQAATKAAAN